MLKSHSHQGFALDRQLALHEDQKRFLGHGRMMIHWVKA